MASTSTKGNLAYTFCSHYFLLHIANYLFKMNDEQFHKSEKETYAEIGCDKEFPEVDVTIVVPGFHIIADNCT